MITDRINWPPKHAPENADAHITSRIVTDKVSPEQVWPYLTNLSDWPRFTRDIADTQFTDITIADPHLFHKAQFIVNTDRFSLVANVLEAVPPKADRPGRISFEGEATGKGQLEGIRFTFVQACLLCELHDHSLQATSEIVLFGDDVKKFMTMDPATIDNFNTEWLHGLIGYVTDHEAHTNHPRNPSSGAMVP